MRSPGIMMLENVRGLRLGRDGNMTAIDFRYCPLCGKEIKTPHLGGLSICSCGYKDYEDDVIGPKRSSN